MKYGITDMITERDLYWTATNLLFFSDIKTTYKGNKLTLVPPQKRKNLENASFGHKALRRNIEPNTQISKVFPVV